jgi:hypothetical protein
VWELGHIDANPHALVKALGSLARREVYVRALRFQGHELELDPPVGRAFAEIMAEIIEVFNAHRRDSVKRALRARSQAGGSAGRYPPMGRKRVTVDGEKLDVWDYNELGIMREIVLRRQRGESFQEIGRDLYERRVRTGSGRFWVKRRGRKGELDIGRLRRAYAKWPEIQAELPFLGPVASEAKDRNPETLASGAP